MDDFDKAVLKHVKALENKLDKTPFLTKIISDIMVNFPVFDFVFKPRRKIRQAAALKLAENYLDHIIQDNDITVYDAEEMKAKLGEIYDDLKIFYYAPNYQSVPESDV
jgi:hypothetical protein